MTNEDSIDFEDLLFEDELDGTEDAVIDEPNTDDPAPDDIDEPEELTQIEEPEEDEPKADLTSYYNFLVGSGALDVPEDFSFDGSEEKLEEALLVSEERKTKQLAQSLWEKLPEDFKPLLSYALNGGTNLQQYLNAYTPVDVTEDMLDADIDLQRKVVRDYYLQTSNHPPERIERMVAKLEDRGHLYDEAVDALEELKQFKEQKKLQLDAMAKAEEEQRKLQAQQEIDKLNKTIEEATFLEAERKNRVKSFVLAPIKVDGKVTTQFDNALEQIFANEQHFVQLADMLADYNPKQGFNFERLEKKIKTKNNTAFKKLLDETLVSTRSGAAKKPLNEDFNWNKYLEQ